ncbi:MAG: hypothetical protein JST82_01450 [Bacteroidetes bacterium]|nr:hypothetical protein [Bacteroidota bacterium]
MKKLLSMLYIWAKQFVAKFRKPMSNHEKIKKLSIVFTYLIDEFEKYLGSGAFIPKHAIIVDRRNNILDIYFAGCKFVLAGKPSLELGLIVMTTYQEEYNKQPQMVKELIFTIQDNTELCFTDKCLIIEEFIPEYYKRLLEYIEASMKPTAS